MGEGGSIVTLGCLQLCNVQQGAVNLDGKNMVEGAFFCTKRSDLKFVMNINNMIIRNDICML